MDREKVIKGLKCLTSMADCTVCPYSYNKQREYCLCDIGKDALALLKEQKAIISMTDEAIGLIDQHYKRLGGIYERRNGS